MWLPVSENQMHGAKSVFKQSQTQYQNYADTSLGFQWPSQYDWKLFCLAILIFHCLSDSGDWDTPKIYTYNIYIYSIYTKHLCGNNCKKYIEINIRDIHVYLHPLSFLLSFCFLAAGTLYTVMQTTRPNGRSNKSNNEARPAVDFLRPLVVGVWCGAWIITKGSAWIIWICDWYLTWLA